MNTYRKWSVSLRYNNVWWNRHVGRWRITSFKVKLLPEQLEFKIRFRCSSFDSGSLNMTSWYMNNSSDHHHRSLVATLAFKTWIFTSYRRPCRCYGSKTLEKKLKHSFFWKITTIGHFWELNGICVVRSVSDYRQAFY